MKKNKINKIWHVFANNIDDWFDTFKEAYRAYFASGLEEIQGHKVRPAISVLG
jgi:hypothetical protein